MRKQEIKSAIATALCITLVAGSLNLSGGAGLNFKAEAGESETVTDSINLPVREVYEGTWTVDYEMYDGEPTDE